MLLSNSVLGLPFKISFLVLTLTSRDSIGNEEWAQGTVSVIWICSSCFDVKFNFITITKRIWRHLLIKQEYFQYSWTERRNWRVWCFPMKLWKFGGFTLLLCTSEQQHFGGMVWGQLQLSVKLMWAGSFPPQQAVVVQFYVEAGKCDGTHSRQLQRNLHTSHYAKVNSLLSIFKKSLKCEVSITDREMSDWVVNSLKTFFSEQQTILCSVVQADTDGDKDVSGINICYPNDRRGQNGGNISPGDSVDIFMVSFTYIVGSKSVEKYVWEKLDVNMHRLYLRRYTCYTGCPWLHFTAAAFCIYKVGETGKVYSSGLKTRLEIGILIFHVCLSPSNLCSIGQTIQNFPACVPRCRHPKNLYRNTYKKIHLGFGELWEMQRNLE